jgi:outer membrane protein TolC
MPGVYYSETPPYSSSGVVYGTQKSFSFILTIPLGDKIFDNSEELSAANSVTEQQVNLATTKTKVVTEINQTYLQYESAKERLKNANISYKQAMQQKQNGVSGIIKFHDAESELIESRTIHAKTLILLNRLGGNFSIPNLD